MDQMNQGTLIIGLGREGKEILRQLKDRSPGDRLEGWMTLSGPGEDGPATGGEEGSHGEVSHLQIRGGGPGEIREELAARADEFGAILSLHCRAFQAKSPEIRGLRYLFLCPLSRPLTGLLLELARLIHRFHRQVTPLPGRPEAVFLLPPPEAGYREKGWGYALLKEVDHSQASQASQASPAPLFDFVWLCDPAGLPRLPSALALYLDDRLPRDFSTSVLHSILPRSFLGKGCRYSTLGTYRLAFAGQEMARFLKNRLEADLLSLGTLKAPKLNPFGLQALVEEFRERLRAYSLEDRRNLLQGKQIEVESEVLLREFETGGEAAIEELLDGIYRKAEILFAQARERIIAAEIRACREEVSQALRRDAEGQMDDPDQGPHVAQAYLEYGLGQEAFYAGLASDPPPARKDLYDLRAILVAPVREQALSLLQADLDEIIGRLLALYGPYQSPGIHWAGVERSPLEVIEDAEATLDLSQLSEEERERAAVLREIREMVRESMAGIARWPGESSQWAELSRGLEVLARENAREKLRELSSLKKELETAREALAEHQRREMSWIFGRRRHQRRLRELTRAYEACQAAYTEGKQALSRIVMERKNRIFQQGLILELHDQVAAAAQEIREEVQGFIRALDEHRLGALEQMKQIEAVLQDDGDTYQVAKARHAGAFYVGEAELPQLLEALCHHLHHGPEPRWSLHYRRVEELLRHLEEFALARFLRLKDWGIEEVLLKLGNCPEAFSKMNAHCQPLAQLKDFPSSPLTTMLYLGVQDEQRTRLRSQDALGIIQGGHQLYTTGQRHVISGLRLAHGFPLFVLGNLRDLREGYQRMREQGEEKEALEGYEPFEELIPEEMEE